MATEEREPCLTPECGKPREWKGLCRSCYGVARHLIDKEETSWEELVALGLALTDVKPFLKAFHAKKRERGITDS